MKYRFGTFQLDTQLLELRQNGDLVPIVPRAFDALCLLIENRDRVVSKDELVASVWRGRIVSDETISSCINAIRRAVGDTGKRQRFLRTAPRRGFRFIMAVVATGDAPPETGIGARWSTEADQSALAVLPFENLSQELEQDHFAEALTQEIVTEFWRWRTLPVSAPDQTVADLDASRVARYVLKGSTRRIGDRVRVIARLIDNETGHHIAIQRINRPYVKSFKIEDDVTNEIVGTLAPKLERIEYERLKFKRPSDQDPHYLVQSGMAFLDEYTREGNLRARELFRDAIDVDPSCSRAHAGIALAISRALMSGYEYCRESAADAAVEAGHRAVGIDGSDAFAYNALCMSYLWARQNDEAFTTIKEAVRLNPSYGHARGSLGDVLVRIGRTEDGIETMKDALRINPDAPNLRHFNAFLARACIATRRHEEAVHWAKRAIHLRSDLGHAYCLLAASLGHIGAIDDATRALDMCKRKHPDFFESTVELRPHEDAAANQHLLEGLYKAGWQN